ncbi:MAG TPA: PHP domain-containing protein [Actinomycetota bacterium]|nr:PHP domain-containing protein [Actinomycetota bacterium]
MKNDQLSELLARASEAEPQERKSKALRRAARAAWMWPVEASDVEDLQELRAVGPYVAGVIRGLLDDPPEPMDPPPIREGFITLSHAREVLAEHPAERAAVRADLQMHTTYSDGAVSVEEMARAAAALGHEYIAITDHSKGLPIAGGIDESVLARQADEITRANEAVPLRILRSMEVNLSVEGEVDMEPDALAQLDVVLAAFHSKLRVKEEQTERYVRALQNPNINTLAHPRGRVFNFRLGLTADWPAVFDAAAANGKALEIDAHLSRQDLNIELLRLAVRAGCTISIGTDAHHPDELAFIDLGIAAAIEADVPFERIINTWEPDRLIEWARAARG